MTSDDVTPEEYRVQVRRTTEAFTESVVQQWEAERRIPASAVTTLGQAGLFRARWAAGAQPGLPYLVVLSEELTCRDTGLAIAAMAHSEAFIGGLTRLAGSQAQGELRELALDGKVVGCFAATEAHGGSSLAAARTQATREPGGWQLTGTKRYVSNLGSATHVLLTARTGPPSAGGAGLSLFVVPLSASGVTIEGFFDTAGTRSCDVGQVRLDVVLPDDALLGSVGLGLHYASHLLQFERLAICAQLHCAADRALRLAAAYARRRPVGDGRVMDKQVIRHRLAHAQAELWNLQSRLATLVARAASEPGMPAHEIAALKLTSGRAVTGIIDMCMQVFGARGITRAYPLERLLRDCRVARLGGGTDEVLADVLASLIDRPDPAADKQLEVIAQCDIPVLRRPDA